MRKILSLILCAAMLLSCVAVASAEEAVKTGLAIIVSNAGSKNAAADAEGVADSYLKIFAVTVDDNGVIHSCIIDSIGASVKFDGNGVITSDLSAAVMTKNELGDSYGMKAYGGAKYEWNEQAANFAAYVTGKTADEVAGIAVAEGKPSDADLSATVTIAIGGFQALIEKACK